MRFIMKATTLLLGKVELQRTVGGRNEVGATHSAHPEGTKFSLAFHEEKSELKIRGEFKHGNGSRLHLPSTVDIHLELLYPNTASL